MCRDTLMQNQHMDENQQEPDMHYGMQEAFLLQLYHQHAPASVQISDSIFSQRCFTRQPNWLVMQIR